MSCSELQRLRHNEVDAVRLACPEGKRCWLFIKLSLKCDV